MRLSTLAAFSAAAHFEGSGIRVELAEFGAVEHELKHALGDVGADGEIPVENGLDDFADPAHADDPARRQSVDFGVGASFERLFDLRLMLIAGVAGLPDRVDLIVPFQGVQHRVFERPVYDPRGVFPFDDRIARDDDLVLDDDAGEMLPDLVEIVGGLPVLLPRVCLRLPAVPGPVALVNGEVCGAARLQSFGRLQDHVAPGFRFLNDVEDVVAGDGVHAHLPDGVEDHPVVVGFAVDGVEDQIFHAFFGEVPRALVELAAAEIEVDRAGLEVDFFEPRRDLPQGGVAASELLPDGVGSFFEFFACIFGNLEYSIFEFGGFAP